MKRTRALVVAGVVSVTFIACGGGGSGSGGGTGGTGSGGGTGGGGTPPPNPCTAALASDVTASGAEPISGMVAGGQAAPVRDKRILVDGDPRGRALEALWLHDVAQRSGRPPRRVDEGAMAGGGVAVGPAAADAGDIAVVQDQGDLILPANTFDIKSTGLRFTPTGGGYAITKIDATFRQALGTRVTLSDDDSVEVDVPFGFSFYGTPQSAAFVNSDGNITFGEEDKASTERDVARLISGPPRVSPFLADLDPSSGGRMFVNAASDQYTVTWCAVRGFDTIQSVTAQATLLPDGSIEYKYADFNLGDAVVGLSPGRTGQFTTADLSVPSPSGGTGAIGERFASRVSIDTVAAAKKFYATHPDNYDQILLWSDQPLIRGAFAYELTVANEIRGIGQDLFDLSHDFGSGGRLRSLVMMDYLAKYPDNPQQKFLGENNTLSVLGQEVGHRWLAYLDFRDRTGARSDALLGRDLAHWSFFFNSEASVMEGNEITDLGGGQFKTTDAVRRYSRLDQYAMGLLPASQVPMMFYVESATGGHDRADAPQIGVTFTGTRRDFPIDDILAVNGQRSPSFPDTPRTHRQAFIYVVSNNQNADAAQIAKLDNIRKQWESFFASATENRMTAITRLR